ncbi:MAG: hypothetical protein IKE69_10310 [Thermoguttaceae bacterium]|nr:hypothetical protein [Thermoguttaceae bacterium]
MRVKSDYQKDPILSICQKLPAQISASERRAPFFQKCRPSDFRNKKERAVVDSRFNLGIL